MEDLRQQEQGQWITTVGDLSLWTINISKDDLFNEVSTRSLYFIKHHTQQPVTSDSPVILDDDRNLYDRYMEAAIQDLLILLARRIPQSKSEYAELYGWEEGQDDNPVLNDSQTLQMQLVMSENHDKHMLRPLANSCKEYLVKKTLEQWYRTDFGSLDEERRLIHTLQFRRKSVARKVRPLL